MKKSICFVCLCILLTACGSNKDNTEELYASVIANYLKYTNDKDLKNSDDTNGMAFLYWQDYYDGLFSAQYDVNEDGVKELLISIRDLQGRYSLLDIYTNKDNSLIRLTNKENGLDTIGEKMNIDILDDGSLIYRDSAELSESGISIYELNDEKISYTKSKDPQESDSNELKQKRIELSELEWGNIGITKVIPLAEYMQSGNFSILKGKWKNELGEMIKIDDNKITFSQGSTADMRYYDSNEDDGIMRINVAFADQTGALMHYIPKEFDGDIPYVEGQTQSNTERITISQAVIGSEEVFYRFE